MISESLLHCCSNCCSQATAVRSADPNDGGFPSEPCSHGHPFSARCLNQKVRTYSTSTCQQGVATVTASLGTHRVGLPAPLFQMVQSGATSFCTPAQCGAEILASNCTRIGDVRCPVNTSRCSHRQMQQTRKVVLQSPRPPFAHSPRRRGICNSRLSRRSFSSDFVTTCGQFRSVSTTLGKKICSFAVLAAPAAPFC